MHKTVFIVISLIALAEVAAAAKGAGSSAQPHARDGGKANGQCSSRGSRDEDLREKYKRIQQKRSQKRKVEEPQPLHNARASERRSAVWHEEVEGEDEQPAPSRAGNRRPPSRGSIRSTSTRASAKGVNRFSNEQADGREEDGENDWGEGDEGADDFYSEEQEEKEEEDDYDDEEDDYDEEEEEQEGAYGGRTAGYPSGRVGARAGSNGARDTQDLGGRGQAPPLERLVALNSAKSGGVMKSMGSVTGKSMKAVVHALQPKSVGLGDILDTWKLEQVIGKPPGRVTRCAATIEFRRDGTVATSFDGRESVSEFTFKAHAWPRACTIEFEARAFHGPWDEEPVWKMYKGSFSRKLLDPKIITLEGTIYDVAGKLLWKRRVKSGKFNARRRPARLTSSRNDVAMDGKNRRSSAASSAGFDRGRGLEAGRRRRGSATTGAPNRKRRKDDGTRRQAREQ